jgi:Flp pilus assembly protein TadG
MSAFQRQSGHHLNGASSTGVGSRTTWARTPTFFRNGFKFSLFAQGFGKTGDLKFCSDQRRLTTGCVMSRRLLPFARRFIRNLRGNVAIIFALSLVPIVFLAGMALDFTSATQKRARLNAAADAAALSAVTPKMASQSTATAQAVAQAVFVGEASTVKGLSYSNPNINIVQNGLVRTATVTYTAASSNAFQGILGQPAWAISGSSTATSSYSPNINFYLLLDNSPSMDIAATTAGINTMVANTKSQGGCAFACHESNPKADNLGNPGGVDNYQLAINLNVVTRIENMATATQSLMTTAATTATATNSTYQMAIYTFNGSGTSTIQKLTSNMTTAAAAAQNINVLEVYDNNWLTKTNQNNDTDTNFETAMSEMNTLMPNPGSGLLGSPPQEVLFLVTDGVDDEIDVSCSQQLSGTRCQEPFDTTWCTKIKSRGIFIAVLYTEYLPLPTNSWYNDWIAPFQSDIEKLRLAGAVFPGHYRRRHHGGDADAVSRGHLQRATFSIIRGRRSRGRADGSALIASQNFAT